jgi:UDP-2,3-diacylglucosamine pyrophosphatase LpxH
LREAAARRLGDGDLELLVYGHSHVAELQRMGGGVYANAGSWLDQPTFLRVTADRIELRRWDETLSDEGVNLNALDRVAKKALA